MDANTKHTPGLAAPQPWRDWINGLRADNADLEADCIALRAENAKLTAALLGAALDLSRAAEVSARESARHYEAIARAALGAK